MQDMGHAGAARVRSLLAAAAAGITLAVCGTALAGDGAGNPHGAAPGQSKADDSPAAHAAPQAHEESGRSAEAPRGQAKEKKATPVRRGKAAAPAKRAKPAKQRSAPGQVKPRTHGPAGKTTICHATGSATNPYVTITISNNALPAHQRHQDGRDIVPAPAGGCPDSAAAPAGKPAKAQGDGKGQDKVTICHATGSETNPFVVITIAASAVEAHRRHQDGRDVIPAPAGGCPAPAVAAAGAPAGKRGGAPAGLPAAGVLNALAPAAEALAPAVPVVAPLAEAIAQTPAADVLGEVVAGGPAPAGAEAPAAAGGVLGAGAGRTVRRESGADAAGAAAGSGGSLPFTGLDLLLIAVAGLCALLAGTALRRSLGRTA